ncbi:MAG: outer membrane lipoprotein carrier protein LolA [Betaproteobacteria bacterium]
MRRLGAWRAMALAATLVATAAPALAFDLAELAASRQRVMEGTARFHETRHVSALAAPVEREGTLLYRRPDYLEMNVESPRTERMVINGRTLRLTTPSGERTLALDSEPMLLAWTESLRATLAGDVPALERFFATSLSGDSGAWKLTLEPREAILRAQIASIVISGAGDAIRRIEMREQGGDDAVMDIAPQRMRLP